MRILIVEDDARLRAVLQQACAEADWHVDAVGDGVAALGAALEAAGGAATYDVIILDLGLPGLDGLEVCRQLRAGGVHTPVLMLTARGEVPQRVEGLDAGGDDYLAKPFELDELFARIRALERRDQFTRTRPVVVGDLVLDPRSRQVTKCGQPVDLTAREFDFVLILARRAGRVVTRESLVEGLWGEGFDLRSNVMDVHMNMIRNKVDKPFGTETFTTVRGVGYRLETV